MLESKGYIDDLSVDEKHKHYIVSASGREMLRYYSGLEELIQV